VQETTQPLQQIDPGAEEHGVAKGDEPDLFARRDLSGQRGSDLIPHRLFLGVVGAHREVAAAHFSLRPQVFAHDGERQAVTPLASCRGVQHIKLA